MSWELLGNNLLGREGEQGPGDSVAVWGLRGGLCMLNQTKQKAQLKTDSNALDFVMRYLIG